MPDDTPTPHLHIDTDWKAQAQAEKERLARQLDSPSPSTPPNSSAPPIQTDENWKAQARAEKERLARQTASAASPASTPSATLPPPTFETLIQTTATQALFALGAIPDPHTGQRIISFDLARFHIDTLAMLEEKTRGNLTKEEADLLANLLYELRSRYIEAVQAHREI